MFAFLDLQVVVDLDYNRIITSEEIPPIPEPEYSFLRGEVIKLLYPNVIGINKLKAGIYRVFEHYTKFVAKQWGADHDLQLSMMCLIVTMFLVQDVLFKFFATLLSGYQNFLENSFTQVFNTQAFLKKQSRATNQSPEPMVIFNS
ncbi:hypothetical protein HN873_029064 [Arachis hypogaea]